jgi:hypothetical protein
MLPGPQNGMIVAFKYADSAIGPYSEILYRCAAGPQSSWSMLASHAAVLLTASSPGVTTCDCTSVVMQQRITPKKTTD